MALETTDFALASAGNEAAAFLRQQRQAFAGDMLPPRMVRDDRLRRLAELVETQADSFAACIAEDFGSRSPAETHITETMMLQRSIRHARDHLEKWMKPRRAPTPTMLWPGRSLMMRQPLGVVGIISPWNYPLQLALAPLVGALAAGNRALLKPSELTARFSAALQRAVAEAFAPDEVAVVTGDSAVGKAFAALPFDHLVFTGSTAIGREVAQSAAKNLTPVTLELGGKSPAIIDTSCDLDAVMDRLAWGKLINAGQTCIAPDYVLVPRGKVDRFVQALRASMARLYPTFHANPDYTSIISARHLARLRELVADAVAQGAVMIDIEPAIGRELAIVGGAANRQMAPVLLLAVHDGMRVMREEIFGPVLPIVPYDSLSDALAYVNQRERPLALYWFGSDRAARQRVLTGTIAGGVSINETLLHQAQDGMPFGGVGPSGHGHYHGEYGFRQFSKEKPVFLQSRFAGTGIIRPPYRPSLGRVLKLISYLT